MAMSITSIRWTTILDSRNCANSAHHKITVYATLLRDEISSASAPDDMPAIKALLDTMRGKIGTKTPYDFPDTPEKFQPAAVGFWNQTVAAYCYCREDQRNVVAETIKRTLDRVEVLLQDDCG